MAARGFLGAGDLYISRYDTATGTFLPFAGPYEASKFEIKPNTDLKELSSRGRSTYGQVIESVPLPQPADFTVELSEVNRESLTIALLGTDTAINTGAGTLTAAPFVMKKNAWVDMGVQNVVAAGFLVKNVGATVTYVLGTDYEVNYRMGWIRLMSSSALADGVTLHITGSYSAVTGVKIRGATNSQVRAKFRLDGQNFADGLPVIVDVWEAVISADSAFDFLSSDFATVSLPGRLKTPVGKSEPFQVQLLDA